MTRVLLILACIIINCTSKAQNKNETFDHEKKDSIDLVQITDSTSNGILAADYLSRVSAEQLGSSENVRVMIKYIDNKDVMRIALDYITNHPVEKNLPLINAISQKAEIKYWAVNFIVKRENETDSMFNLGLMEIYKNTAEIQSFAKNYIYSLTEQVIFTRPVLEFIADFTLSSEDRGFRIFYSNEKKVNEIMQDGHFVSDILIGIIAKEEYNRSVLAFDGFALQMDKETVRKTPDWNYLKKIIRIKYDKDYAVKVMIICKLDWLNYLIGNKKQEQYWPEFCTVRIKQINSFKYDTMWAWALTINNCCWNEYFVHCADKKQLYKSAKWMEEILARRTTENLFYFQFADTYACLLYKAGRTSQGIAQEEKNLKDAQSKKDSRFTVYYTNIIEKMKRGEPFWTKAIEN